ncbi:MAG: hydrolase [Deltaproteobacteria bacterium]|nr:hydrolase [Deltaproteobacteria bacterium]
MKLRKDNTVALVVDIQEKLFPHVAERELMLKRTTILLEGLAIFQIPLLVTQQYTKGLGESVGEIKRLIGDVTPIDKLSFSCCGEAKLMDKLLNTEIENVIICGIEAHVCVLQTALDLLDEGYQSIVVEDCVSSRRLNDKQLAIARMRQEGAIITTYESLLFEICGRAGTEPFRALSTLIKQHG